jgi:cytochrome P450
MRPVQGLAGTTTRDVTVADMTVPEGDPGLPPYGSADHDEAVFGRHDTLDSDRKVDDHGTFGHGGVARLPVLLEPVHG